MKIKGYSTNIKYPMRTPRKVGRRHSPEMLQFALENGKLNRKRRRALKLKGGSNVVET